MFVRCISLFVIVALALLRPTAAELPPQSVCPFGYVNISIQAQAQASSSSSVNVVTGPVVVLSSNTSASASTSINVTITTIPPECQPVIPCDCPINEDCGPYRPQPCPLYCIGSACGCPQYECTPHNCTAGKVYNRILGQCVCPSNPGPLPLAPNSPSNSSGNSSCAPPPPNCTCTNATDICFSITPNCATCPNFECCPSGTYWNDTARQCVSENICIRDTPCPANSTCIPCATNSTNCTQGYQCHCLPGYDSLGGKCIPTNPCCPNPCPSYSFCENRNQTAFCICEPGFTLDKTGTQCVVENKCDSITCPANSSCMFQFPSNATCICAAGYIMSHDKTKCSVNPCAGVHCDCGKTCVASADGKSHLCLEPACPLGTQYSSAHCGCANFTCPLGFHFDNTLRYCIPNSLICSANPCINRTDGNTVCLYKPQVCTCSPPTCSSQTTSATATSQCTASSSIAAPWGTVSASSSAYSSVTLSFTQYTCQAPNCQCTQYQCVAQPTCPAGTQYDNYTGECYSQTYVSVNPSQGCVYCPQLIPRCTPSCGDDEECIVYPQSCSNCAYGQCVSKTTNCVHCPSAIPQCPPAGCQIGSKCVQVPGNCTSCAQAYCQSY